MRGDVYVFLLSLFTSINTMVFVLKTCRLIPSLLLLALWYLFIFRTAALLLLLLEHARVDAGELSLPTGVVQERPRGRGGAGGE